MITRMRDMLEAGQRVFVFFALPIAAGILLIYKPLLSALVGAEYLLATGALVFITIGQIMLGETKAAFRRLAPPFDGCLAALRHALALIEQDADIVLCLGIAGLGQGQPFPCGTGKIAALIGPVPGLEIRRAGG